jgi:hypothetical protein
VILGQKDESPTIKSWTVLRSTFVFVQSLQSGDLVTYECLWLCLLDTATLGNGYEQINGLHSAAYRFVSSADLVLPRGPRQRFVLCATHHCAYSGLSKAV